MLEERFWSKVDKNDCWYWTAARGRDGYGRFYLGGHTRQAHRVAYELEVGPIPDGLQLDHLCRVRHCVNPAHLEPVTSRENTLRGTAPNIRAAQINLCARGHDFTPDNTYVRPDGTGRQCRACCRLRDRERYARSKAAA